MSQTITVPHSSRKKKVVDPETVSERFAALKALKKSTKKKIILVKDGEEVKKMHKEKVEYKPTIEPLEKAKAKYIEKKERIEEKKMKITI